MLGVRAHDYPKGTPKALFSAIAGDGWQTIQLAPMKALTGVNAPEDLTAALAEEIAGALGEAGLFVAVYGAYVEPSLMDEEARRAQIETFRQQIPFAGAVGSACIATETTPMEKQPGISRPEALGQLRRSLEALLPEAQAQKVPLALEPVFSHALSTPELVRHLLRDMATPWLRIVLDPVNLLSPETLDRQAELWQRSFDAFGPEIAAIHIKGAVWPQGAIEASPLADSQVDYASFGRLLLEQGRQIPLLREEARPQLADEERDFMARITQGR